MFELLDTHSQNAVIKVIGVGGGGGRRRGRRDLLAARVGPVLDA